MIRLSLAHRRRAMTLLEVLVSSAIFALFVFMVGDMVVKAYQSKNLTEEKLQARRNASIFMARVRRELNIRHWASPFDDWGAPYDNPDNIPKATYPMCVMYHTTGGQIVTASYYFDPASETVYRCFDIGQIRPGDVMYGYATLSQPRAIIRNVKGFTVTADMTNFIGTINLQIATFTEPFSTTFMFPADPLWGYPLVARPGQILTYLFQGGHNDESSI